MTLLYRLSSCQESFPINAFLNLHRFFRPIPPFILELILPHPIPTDPLEVACQRLTSH